MYHYVYEEKLKNRLEHVLLDPRGLVLMPVSNKSNILNLLVVLENLFNRSQKLQSPVVRPNPDDRPVVYLEHTAKDTLDVAKSHLNWMNFRGRHYFQDIDDNPFAFKNISTVSSAAELVTELEEPRPPSSNENCDSSGSRESAPSQPSPMPPLLGPSMRC